MSTRRSKPIKRNPELHHNPLVLDAIVLHMPPRILMHIKGVHNAEGQLVGLALPGETTRLLHWDHLVIRVKLIQEEDEEFVEQLTDTGCVSRLRNVLLVDHIQIVFKESVSFNHAEHARVRIASLTVTIVGSSSLFALKLLYGHRIVDSLWLLWSEFSLLEARQDRWLTTLTEGDDHQGQSIGREIPIWGSNNFHALGPMLQKDC